MYLKEDKSSKKMKNTKQSFNSHPFVHAFQHESNQFFFVRFFIHVPASTLVAPAPPVVLGVDRILVIAPHAREEVGKTLKLMNVHAVVLGWVGNQWCGRNLCRGVAVVAVVLCAVVLCIVVLCIVVLCIVVLCIVVLCTVLFVVVLVDLFRDLLVFALFLFVRFGRVPRSFFFGSVVVVVVESLVPYWLVVCSRGSCWCILRSDWFDNWMFQWWLRRLWRWRRSRSHHRNWH